MSRMVCWLVVYALAVTFLVVVGLMLATITVMGAVVLGILGFVVLCLMMHLLDKILED